MQMMQPSRKSVRVQKKSHLAGPVPTPTGEFQSTSSTQANSRKRASALSQKVSKRSKTPKPTPKSDPCIHGRRKGRCKVRVYLSDMVVVQVYSIGVGNEPVVIGLLVCCFRNIWSCYTSPAIRCCNIIVFLYGIGLRYRILHARSDKVSVH
jgi:hypothetical protein